MSLFGTAYNPSAITDQNYNSTVINPLFDGPSALKQQVQYGIFQRLHNIDVAFGAAKNPEGVLEDFRQNMTDFISASKTSTFLFDPNEGLLNDISKFKFLTPPMQHQLTMTIGKQIMDTVQNAYLASNPAAVKILSDIGVDLGLNRGMAAPRAIRKPSRSKRSSRSKKSSRSKGR